MTTGIPKLWNDADADRADVLVEFAGCGADEESADVVMATLHDRALGALRDQGLRQAGPVEWIMYDPAVTDDLLAAAGLADHPNAQGLRAFLDQPDVQLVVCTVAYLRPS